jgi:hypothetical protein
MKKGLLFLFALTLGVVTSQAQMNKAFVRSKASALQKMQKFNSSKRSVAPLIQKSSRRAAGDVSVMYAYPAGPFYYGLTDECYYYQTMQMLTGAFDDTEFSNYTSKEEADGSFTGITDVTWDWGTNSETGEAIKPLAQKTDENGSMIAQAFGSMRFPTLKYGDQSFEYTVTSSDGNTTYPCFWTAGTEGIADFEFSDGNGGTEVYKGTVGNYIPGLGLYSGFGGDYGFISNKTFYNLENYQTTKQWNNTGKKTIGFAEYYVKPVSHVYAESVVAWYWFDDVTDKTKPLGGKTITATICTFGEDNKLVEYATATATDDDVVIVSSENSLCYIEFKFSESDPILGDVDAPIVLPDEDFIVMLTGFDEVTGNFQSPITSADGWEGYGYAILEDQSISTIGYTNNPKSPQVSLPIGFRAALPVATYAEANLPAVLFTEEGGVGAGIEGNDGLYGFSLIYTMSGKDQWEIVEKPDWISTIELDDESVAERGNMFVTLEAEALPSGTDERSGKVVLELYGKQVEIPVYQSPNALGVKNISVDRNNNESAAYNLAGQRVNKDYKGLIIKDGRKFMNK